MYSKNDTSPDREFRGSYNDDNQDNRLRVMEERKKRLVDEFSQYNTKHQQMIEREEVKMILDQRLRHTGKVFDDELIDAIFNNLDRDLNGRISKQEFWQGYVDVENFFVETINTCNYKILELK